MKKISKILVSILLLIALVVPTFMVSAESVDQPVHLPNEGTSSDASSKSKVFSHAKAKSGIKKYKEISSDVHGWLHLTNSNMSMPIVRGIDNNYYEKRTWDGTNYPNNNYKNYRETATFLDYRVKLGNTWKKSSSNIVIYGHNWNNLKEPFVIGNNKNYEMFAQLASYNDLAHSKNNPYIYFSTENMEGIWKIFAVGYGESSTKLFNFNTPNMKDEDVAALAKEWKSRSLHNFDVDVKGSDTLLTLSTCTRNYAGIGDGQRYVVVARLLRPDEKDSQAVKVTNNENVKQPSFVK